MSRLSLSFLFATLAVACHGPTDRAADPMADFLAANPDFGVLVWTEAMPDWAEGARRRVLTDRGSFAFYMKRGEVYAVFSVEERFGHGMLTCVHYRSDAHELGGELSDRIDRCRSSSI